MKGKRAIRNAVSIPVDQPMPAGATWTCEHCGPADHVLRLPGSEVELVCTPDRIIGVTLDADDIAGHKAGKCLNCGKTYRAPKGRR